MRVIFHVLSKLGFVLWCCFAVFMIPFILDAVHSHDLVQAVIPAAYALIGVVLFKWSRIPKSFQTRIEAMKREGFKPELELVNRGEFAGFSRPQNKAVFMRWYDDKCIEMPLSNITGVKPSAREFIEVHTSNLNMPRIGLHVPASMVDDWMARLNIILNERAAA